MIVLQPAYVIGIGVAPTDAQFPAGLHPRTGECLAHADYF
jgi:hypothetical protein